VIQNGSAQNAAIPTAMGVRSYQGEMALMVAHCAATRISMAPNAVALTEPVQISAPQNVGIQGDSALNEVTHFARALHCVAEPQFVQVVHFFAVAIRSLELVIHSAARAAPARFAHHFAWVSRSHRSLYLDRLVTDDLRRRRVRSSSQKIVAPAFHLMNETERHRQCDPMVGAVHALDALQHQSVVLQSRYWKYSDSKLASRVLRLVR
jgi:hypothetical protein